MASSQEPAKVRRGIRIDPDSGDSVDFASLGILLARPRPVEATEGQAWYTDYTQCPWCGHIGWTTGLNTDFYVDVVCGSCGRYFRA
ncbi:hypothetical protein [Zavarzinia sp.]|uniref:hypothetical protein n=1 Tax=Zavarzinia sp. TaxID=2027920 RepID=UPI003569F242